MSLTTHVLVLGLVILDLLLGGAAVEKYGGSLALTAFEFVTILGYIIFILQWGVPWGQREQDDN